MRNSLYKMAAIFAGSEDREIPIVSQMGIYEYTRYVTRLLIADQLKAKVERLDAAARKRTEGAPRRGQAALTPAEKDERESLLRHATAHRDNPRVVLLSPGPRSATYFEDSYLSRYLGYTMVEGGDLTVRDNIVFLKTLGGLLPVDVILRRVIDDYCDPLELRGDSLLGVPGLVQAARRTSCRAASTSLAMSAIMKLTASCAAMGTPKAVRSLA